MSAISAISVYVKAHEKLVLSLVAVAALWLAAGKVQGIIAQHDNANLQQAILVDKQQAEQNTALAIQVSQQAANYKALSDKVNAQNDTLERANIALANALVSQQAKDKTMTPTELTQRWNVLVPEAGVSVTNGQVAVPTEGARATLQQLELVPIQQKELVNVRQENVGLQSLLTASGQQVITLNGRVSGLELKAQDDAKVCSAQIAVVKAEARRSKRRWLYAGMVIGFLGRQAIKTYTGF